MRRGAVRSLPAAHRLAARNIPEPESAGRRAGSAPLVRRPGWTLLPPGVPGCCGEFDTLHLWIYKDGALVGASPGIIASRSRPSWRSRRTAATTVDRVDPTYNVAPLVEYEALAKSSTCPSGARQAPAARSHVPRNRTHHVRHAVVPDFRARPAGRRELLRERDAEDGAQTCLRFDQIVANRGAGPIEIACDVPTGATPDANAPFPSRSACMTAMGRSPIGPAEA